MTPQVLGRPHGRCIAADDSPDGTPDREALQLLPGHGPGVLSALVAATTSWFPALSQAEQQVLAIPLALITITAYSLNSQVFKIIIGQSNARFPLHLHSQMRILPPKLARVGKELSTDKLRSIETQAKAYI